MPFGEAALIIPIHGTNTISVFTEVKNLTGRLQISEGTAHGAGSLIPTSPKLVTRDGLPVRHPAKQEGGTFREGE
jgi:hypothetical protein